MHGVFGEELGDGTTSGVREAGNETGAAELPREVEAEENTPGGQLEQCPSRV